MYMLVVHMTMTIYNGHKTVLRATISAGCNRGENDLQKRDAGCNFG